MISFVVAIEKVNSAYPLGIAEYNMSDSTWANQEFDASETFDKAFWHAFREFNTTKQWLKFTEEYAKFYLQFSGDNYLNSWRYRLTHKGNKYEVIMSIQWT